MSAVCPHASPTSGWTFPSLRMLWTFWMSPSDASLMSLSDLNSSGPLDPKWSRFIARTAATSQSNSSNSNLQGEGRDTCDGLLQALYIPKFLKSVSCIIYPMIWLVQSLVSGLCEGNSLVMKLTSHRYTGPVCVDMSLHSLLKRYSFREQRHTDIASVKEVHVEFLTQAPGYRQVVWVGGVALNAWGKDELLHLLMRWGAQQVGVNCGEMLAFHTGPHCEGRESLDLSKIHTKW